MRVQALVAQLPVERLNECIVRGLPGPADPKGGEANSKVTRLMYAQ